MQCPRCKTNDVYRSQSATPHILSFLMQTVRCHRCCLQFSVPRWSQVPTKVATRPNLSEHEGSRRKKAA